MNNKQIEQYRNWALEAPAYDRGAIINQVSADGVYSNAGGGEIEHHLDDVRTIIAQHDRIAELERYIEQQRKEITQLPNLLGDGFSGDSGFESVDEEEGGE